jgi:hypothetical protein
MKKLTLIVATLLAFGLAISSFAQQQQQTSVPHAFKYQAVARNANGEVISNQNVSFRISIVQGSASGTTVYEETQQAATNQFGLANLSIGQGTLVTGSFNDILWSEGTYFVKIEFDPKGGSDFTLTSTSQMLSVPYALYSENANNVTNFPLKAALVSTNVAGPINNPETGMLVYNTATSGTEPYDVTPGYYYNAGTSLVPNWVPISSKYTSEKDHRLFVTFDSTSTTYGGITKDGACSGSGNQGSITSCPTGSDNTAFGTNTFGGRSSTNPSGTDNTAMGFDGMKSITSGNYNTAIGSEALYTNANAGANTSVGYQSLYSVVSNGDNTAIGYQAMYGSTGPYNTATGYAALKGSNTGKYNTANGFESMLDNTSGENNTGMGTGTLLNNSTGANNAASGFDALLTNVGGNGNTAQGYLALYYNTVSANTAMGDSALFKNSTGIYNTATGYNALAANTTASENTATGYRVLYTSTGANNTGDGNVVLYKNTTGNTNTGVGDSALYNNSTGDSNTAVGYDALITNTTGTKNTAIGTNANVASNNLTNATAVGFGAIVCSNNSMMFGNGNVTQWNFGWSCSSTCTPGFINVHTSAGTVSMSAGGIWSVCSDRNKKKNFAVVNGADLLNKIASLSITRWNYKWDSTDVQHLGPMAQDFYKAFGLNNDSLHITSVDEDGVALAGIQALNKKLEEENAALKAELNHQKEAQSTLKAELDQQKNSQTMLQQIQANDEKEMAELKSALNSLLKTSASIK